MLTRVLLSAILVALLCHFSVAVDVQEDHGFTSQLKAKYVQHLNGHEVFSSEDKQHLAQVFEHSPVAQKHLTSLVQEVFDARAEFLQTGYQTCKACQVKGKILFGLAQTTSAGVFGAVIYTLCELLGGGEEGKGGEEGSKSFDDEVCEVVAKGSAVTLWTLGNQAFNPCEFCTGWPFFACTTPNCAQTCAQAGGENFNDAALYGDSCKFTFAPGDSVISILPSDLPTFIECTTGANSCNGATFICDAAQPCRIDCLGENSCNGVTLNCPTDPFSSSTTPTTNCQIQCLGKDSCDGLTVNGGPEADVRVQCDAGHFPSSQATDEVCKDASVTCTDDGCNIYFGCIGGGMTCQNVALTTTGDTSRNLLDCEPPEAPGGCPGSSQVCPAAAVPTYCYLDNSP